jgi:hypothetical protein
MKTKFLMATAAAAFALAGAGSAFAQSTYSLSSSPTLSSGDDAFVNVIDTTAPTVMFQNTYDFDLAGVGPTTDVYTSINDVAYYKYASDPSISNLVVSFYDLSKGDTLVGSIVGGTGTIALASNQDYAVTITGNTTTKYGGSYQFDVQTSPVPGPAGFLVAMGGMGALLLQRRRLSRAQAV